MEPITAEVARKTIALEIPQKSEEEKRAERIVNEHELVLQRKVAEGKWDYQFTLPPEDLLGVKSYQCNRSAYTHKEEYEVACHIVMTYRSRGFKSHYSVTDIHFNFCRYTFTVSWRPEVVAEQYPRRPCIIS
jgi:hypothetical protein